MIQIINQLDSPTKVQEKIDKAYKNGYSLEKVTSHYRVYKKEKTLLAYSYLVEKEAKIKCKDVIYKEKFNDPNVSIRYCLKDSKNKNMIDDSLLIDYYQHQRQIYSKHTLFFCVLSLAFLCLILYTNILVSFVSGWAFIIINLFLLYRFITYRKFYKTIFNPLLKSTNSIDLKKANNMVIITNRKLDDNEFKEISKLGKLEYSNTKKQEFIYKLQTLAKHKKVVDEVNKFDTLQADIFTTTR
ncbi:MAG: hypothetical protein ACK5KQ_01130 [Anaerorhabdus sp.]